MKKFFRIFLFFLLSSSFFSLKAQRYDRQENDDRKSNQKQSSEEQQQPDSIKLRLIDYRIDPTLGDLHFAKPDTFPYNFQNNTYPERNKSIITENIANIGGPIQSVVFNERVHKTPFIFMNSYDFWIQTPEEFVFHNTTKPYSNLTYLTTIGNKTTQEDDFKFTFYVNPNKNLNVGFDVEKVSARGFYNRNASRNTLFNFFGNYTGDKYNAFWKLSSYNNENFENGGIADDDYITNPEDMSGGEKEYESLNIPINLSDDRSKVKYNSLFFFHKYNLGYQETSKDSLKAAKDFVPVASVFNSFYIASGKKEYTSGVPLVAFYDSIANISDSITNDESNFTYFRTSLGVSLNEGFRDWVFADLKAFLTYEAKNYTYYDPNSSLKDLSDIFSRTSSSKNHNIWAGVNSSRHQGKYLNYNATGKIILEGDHMGDYDLIADIKTLYNIGKLKFNVNLFGNANGTTPDFFMEKYYANSISWDNDLDRELSTKIGGSIFLNNTNTNFRLTIENKKNYTYFKENYKPTQYGGNLQILTAEFNQMLHLGSFHFDNKLVYQQSSDEDILALPKLALYSNLYLKTNLSKVLLTYMGVDCRYFTEYYAQGYMPATEQFYNQKELKIGNYPYMNAYLNFRLKTCRFFLVYSHLSRLFANPNYFSTPHYPLNPATFKLGFSWDFFN